MTGALHFEVHPCGAHELLVDPLPESASREGALYPDGAHIKDVEQVRDLLYKMQRPAIAPNVRCSLFHPPPPNPHFFLMVRAAPRCYIFHFI